MLELYIDADACPVREEAFRVAERHGLRVHAVTCGNVRVPRHPDFRTVLVEAGADAADDWIAEQIGTGDICITNDIPLAARCLERGAEALGASGRRFTARNIGEALAGRELSAHLRELGAERSGPRPLSSRDRSQFLSALDTIVQEIRRRSR